MISHAAKEKLAKLLCPDITGLPVSDDSGNFRVPASMSQKAVDEEDSGQILTTSVLTETALNKVADALFRGNQDSALRIACDRRLWSHAMIIASRSGPQVWSNVVQEFTQVELQSSSEAAQSLKFLYQSFANVVESARKFCHSRCCNSTDQKQR